MKARSSLLPLIALSQGSLNAQTAVFDINSDDQGNGLPGANLEDWTPLDIPNAATGGPFSATSGDITLSLNSTGDFRGRDRGTAETTQGTDNNDNAVPVGPFADMYRDFAFLFPGDNLTGTLSGLVADANYFVTIVSWDSGQGGENQSSWGPTGDATNSLIFAGDLVNNNDISTDPDTRRFTDKSTTFTITADDAGGATFEGLSVAGAILAFNGVVLDVDADADGLPDSFEQQIIDADENDDIAMIEDVDPAGDFDSDMSTNLQEFQNNTDPVDEDTDDDQLLDGVENGANEWTDVTMTGTDPLNPDSDGDGLLDGVENPDLNYDGADPAAQPGTDPNLFDTDEDGIGDGTEVLVDNTDPTDPTSFFNPLVDSVVAFDFGPADVQEGWIGAPLGAGTDGTITVATEAIGGAGLEERDRAAANSNTGDTANEAMWRDFLFASGSVAGSVDIGLRVTITGLAPSTIYPINIWAYDDITAVAGASMLWNGNGLTLNESDPVSLSDTATRTRFEASSDASGTIILEGFTGIEEPVNASNNVFINGLVVGAPSGSTAPVITAIVPDSAANNVTLTWDSRPGAKYIVRVSTDLTGAPNSWTDLVDDLDSGGMETTFTDSSGLDGIPVRFYVVEETAAE